MHQNIPHQKLLQEIMPYTDINVLPTFDDTFWYVIAEAMHAGLPNIATNIFAISEMVQHGVNGYLINLPVDKYGMIDIFWEKDMGKRTIWFEEQEVSVKNQLKKYIIRLVENEEIREEMGRKGREKALAKFHCQVRNKKLGDIYRRCK